MSPLRAGCVALALTVAPVIGLAHEGSTSYLMLDATGERALHGRFDVALIDLAFALPLDVDADGRLNWHEIEANRAAIAARVAGNISLARGGRRCATRMGALWLTRRLGLPYLSLDLSADCPSDGALALSSSLLFDEDDDHRVLLSVATTRAQHAAALAPDQRAWSEPAAVSAWSTAWRFVRQGAWHVWIGHDHMLFLLLLLLPAVARRARGSASRAGPIALDLARIVTAFTVAHSITLALAATAVLKLPQQPVEAAIALSLVIAAGLNLAPQLARWRLALAFGFGLVHGVGFANALAGLGAGDLPMLPVLAGFNVGVELANLAAIAVALPLLLAISRFGWYAPRAMPAISLAAGAIGLAWMYQRF